MTKFASIAVCPCSSAAVVVADLVAVAVVVAVVVVADLVAVAVVVAVVAVAVAFAVVAVAAVSVDAVVDDTAVGVAVVAAIENFLNRAHEIVSLQVLPWKGRQVGGQND